LIGVPEASGDGVGVSVGVGVEVGLGVGVGVEVGVGVGVGVGVCTGVGVDIVTIFPPCDELIITHTIAMIASSNTAATPTIRTVGNAESLFWPTGSKGEPHSGQLLTIHAIVIVLAKNVDDLHCPLVI
jgi:hypothetical protein